MVTKEELNECINSFTEKFNYISEELEQLWQMTNSLAIKKHDDEIRKIADRIEHLQFGHINPRQLGDNFRYKDLCEIIEENEKIKDIDKFLEYQRFIINLKKRVNEL